MPTHSVATCDLRVEYKPLDLDEQRRMEEAIGWDEFTAADAYRRAMTTWATRVNAPARPGQSRARSRRTRTVRKAAASATSSDGDPEPSPNGQASSYPSPFVAAARVFSDEETPPRLDKATAAGVLGAKGPRVLRRSRNRAAPEGRAACSPVTGGES